MSQLKVEPSPEITFEVANGKANSCPLRVYNSGTETTAFKVKTTAPKKYCVRPNAGVIPAGKHVEVQVIPQVSKNDATTLMQDLSGKCKDKFMIQSALYASEQPPDSQWWTSVTEADLQQTLLRCKYKLSSSAEAAASIPEGGEPGLFAMKAINVNEIDLSNPEGVKQRIEEFNKDLSETQLKATSTVTNLKEEVLKLRSDLASARAGRQAPVPAAPAGAIEGFTPMFLILVMLVAWVLGVYTSLMTLPK